MIKYWINRPTAAKSTILNDSVVASFEIVKQLKQNDNDPDQFSLVARSTVGMAWVIRHDRPNTDLPQLVTQVNKIKTDIEAAAGTGKTIFFVTIDGDDLPDLKKP